MVTEAAVTRRVLVVDDDPAIVRLLKGILGREGFEVSGVEDGETGLARASVEKPDLVILDFELPKLDGIQVLTRLKTETPELPVVMLTGHEDVKFAV